MTVRVLIADDHPLVRQGLRNLLEEEPGIHIVGECGDGLETVQVAEQLYPDVLIVDLMMPGLNGSEVIRRVRQRLPRTQVIVLSMHKDDSYVLEALQNGANGYILKDTAPQEVLQAIRETTAGHRFLSQSISQKINQLLDKRRDDAAPTDYEGLTNREREVLQLTAEGLTSTEVAGRLGISPRTVEVHRSNLMQKLGLKNQSDLIRYAIKRGILPLDQ